MTCLPEVRISCSSERDETGMNGTTHSGRGFRVTPVAFLTPERSAPSTYDALRVIMWVISFTFKYLPNIIQKFCMHAAVRENVR